MSRYNYFDDDDDIIEEVDSKPRHISRSELADAIRAFSVTEGNRIKRAAHTLKDTEAIDDFFSRKKRIVTIVLIFVVIIVFSLMVLTVSYKMNNENQKIQKFNADAGKVCADYISDYGNCSYENLYSSYGVNGYRMTGLSYVREMDFDDDGNSELLVVYNDGGVYYAEVWGYNSKGEFDSLYHQTAAQTTNKEDDAWVTIYRHNNKYYIGAHDSDDITKVSLYTLKGGEFEKKYTCTYDENAEAFVIRKKVNTTDFERIKLSVLREEKATVTLDLVTNTIDDFSASDSSTTATKTSSQSIENAYYSIVDDYNQTYGTASYKEENGVAYLDGLAVVKLVDFDSDGTNELMLIYRKGVKVRDEDSNGDYISVLEYKYFCDIYRYNGTSASLAYQNEGLSNSLNDSNDIYAMLWRKDKKYWLCNNTFSTENYGKVINASSNILKFNGTSFDSVQKAQYYTEWGWTEYYIDGEEVYKSKFNEREYTVPLFDGTSDYDEDEYAVIYLQRKVTKSGNMQGQVNTTKSVIQKLNASYSG